MGPTKPVHTGADPRSDNWGTRGRKKETPQSPAQQTVFIHHRADRSLGHPLAASHLKDTRDISTGSAIHSLAPRRDSRRPRETGLQPENALALRRGDDAL
ncbi:unnamed protein product [Natator depressus]